MNRFVAWTLVALLVAVPLASADAGQFRDDQLDYGLTDQDTGPVAPSELVMRREKVGEGGTIPIVVAEQVRWIAEEPAKADMNVAEQRVDVHLRFLARSSVESVTMCVGEADAAGFTSHGCDTETGGPDLSEVVEFGVEVDEHTIQAGQRPAVRMSVDTLRTGTGVAFVETGPASAVHYTATANGSGGPFIPNGTQAHEETQLGSQPGLEALQGLGLLAVVGAAWFRRQ